jgi:hypothetical protein
MRPRAPARELTLQSDFIRLHPKLITHFSRGQCVFFPEGSAVESSKQKGVLMPVMRIMQFCPQGVAIWRHLASWMCLAIIVLLSPGCSTVPFGGFSASSSVEQKNASVRERAISRWQALIGNDIPRAYEFLSPTTREVVSLDQYRAKVARGTFRAAKIDTVDCEAELCKVKIQLTYDRARMKGIQTPVEETWIIERGQFWYVFRG